MVPSRPAWSSSKASVVNSSNVDAKRAELETEGAQRDADIAEKDATFAVRFTVAAVEEAKYAALYATLARMDADSSAAKSG